MTTDPDSPANVESDAPQSSIPFDPLATLKTGVRVNLAHFGKLMGVSKQAASEWKRKGLITVGYDGLVNPTEAAQQLMRNADPTRLRARTLRAAAAEPDNLRQRLRATEQALESLRQQQARSIGMDHVSDALWYLVDAIATSFPHLCAAAAEGDAWLRVRLAQLADRFILGESDADLLSYPAEYDLPADAELPAWMPSPPAVLHGNTTTQ